MSNSSLLFEKQNGIAIVTLNRPEAMNALSKMMRDALITTFRQIQADAEIRVVI